MNRAFSFQISGALLVLLSSSSSFANVGQEFGFGSRTAALGGAGVASTGSDYAAYSNPAALPFQGDKRLQIHLGVLSMTPSFTPIQNVIVSNAYTSEDVKFGDVEDDYRTTLGQTLSLAYRVLPDTMNFTLGVTAFLPLQQVAYMDTGETFVPEYFLYRARTQRPQVEVGFGADLGAGFHFGLGLHIAYALTSNATAYLQSDSAKPSTLRFAASLKPKVAPQIGLLYAPEGENSAFTFGAVLRTPITSPNNLYLRSAARAFGSFAALDFNFSALSTLYYDPLSIELGATLAESSAARTFVQVDYQGWSKFQAPSLYVQDPKVEGCGSSPCGINISGGQIPPVDYRDILVPRIGQELTLGNTTLRIGYAYRPSILKGLPTEAGNYLDPPKHMFTAGLGFQFSRFLSFNVPTTLNFNLAYHQLVTQHVEKSPGDENGNGSGDLKIGAPGYDAGGKILGGGVDLSLAL